MDLLKKIFGLNQNQDEVEKNSQTKIKDEFRKPIWIEDYETDDDLLENDNRMNLHIFSNSVELQKHFEQQINEMLRAFEENDNITNFDYPGYEKAGDKDVDKDGEIYADQLNSLLQRISPELKAILPHQMGTTGPRENVKRTEEESIMDRIHGTYTEDRSSPPRKRMPKLPDHPRGVFEGAYQNPRVFGHSIITQTIRKPDGSHETRRFTKDSKGNIETTITKMVDGRETVTSYNSHTKEEKVFDGARSLSSNHETTKSNTQQSQLASSDRNITVTKFGYVLPKNLW